MSKTSHKLELTDGSEFTPSPDVQRWAESKADDGWTVEVVGTIDLDISEDIGVILAANAPDEENEPRIFVFQDGNGENIGEPYGIRIDPETFTPAEFARDYWGLGWGLRLVVEDLEAEAA